MSSELVERKGRVGRLAVPHRYVRQAQGDLESSCSKDPTSSKIPTARFLSPGGGDQMQTGDQDCKRNARVLACLRISVGVLFLIFGEYKVFGTGFTLGGGFEMWINRFLGGSVYPF